MGGAAKVSIPDEVGFYILAWVPLKSLMRFRCVCRQWRSLIDHDAAFAKQVYSCSKTRLVLSFVDTVSSSLDFSTADTAHQEPTRPFLSFPLAAKSGWTDHPSRCCFSNSINGLVCFPFRGRIFICNPSIRETFVLPPLIEGPISFCSRRIYLGYDTCTHSYNILNTCINLIDLTICRFDILTVGESCWRRLDRLSDYHVKPGSSRTDALANGAICWKGIDKTECIDAVVVAFHFAEERFEVIPLPTGLTSSRSVVVLGIDGQLVAVKVDLSNRIKEAWTMKDYANKVWALEFSDDGLNDRAPESGDRSDHTLLEVKPEQGTRKRLVVATSYVESIFSPRGKLYLTPVTDLTSIV